MVLAQAPCWVESLTIVLPLASTIVTLKSLFEIDLVVAGGVALCGACLFIVGSWARYPCAGISGLAFRRTLDGESVEQPWVSGVAGEGWVNN